MILDTQPDVAQTIWYYIISEVASVFFVSLIWGTVAATTALATAQQQMAVRATKPEEVSLAEIIKSFCMCLFLFPCENTDEYLNPR